MAPRDDGWCLPISSPKIDISAFWPAKFCRCETMQIFYTRLLRRRTTVLALGQAYDLPLMRMKKFLTLAPPVHSGSHHQRLCQKAVRGDDVAGLDTSHGYRARPSRLAEATRRNMNAMDGSAVVKRWEGEEMPQVGVLPFRNETSEHIDSALDALISDVETALINGGHVSVISLESQQQLMAEVKRQQGEGFDQGKAAAFGRQMGVKYIVTGKVFTTDEKMNDERRVQYYLFMQVLAVETGQILFQNKAAVTKAIM